MGESLYYVGFDIHKKIIAGVMPQSRGEMTHRRECGERREERRGRNRRCGDSGDMKVKRRGNWLAFATHLPISHTHRSPFPTLLGSPTPP